MHSASKIKKYFGASICSIIYVYALPCLAQRQVTWQIIQHFFCLFVDCSKPKILLLCKRDVFICFYH